MIDHDEVMHGDTVKFREVPEGVSPSDHVNSIGLAAGNFRGGSRTTWDV